MDVEEILPLSPLQEGLLFHALYDAQGPDVYTVQLTIDLKGPLDEQQLKASAQALLQRHMCLRAAFQYENLRRPVQIIFSRVPLCWQSVDLSLLDEPTRKQHLTELPAKDRLQRFDLTLPPLLRFTLIRLAARQHHLILTNHHILLDGWSMPILVQELLALYAQNGDASALPPVTPYREYLAWIAAQDRTAAVAAWREELVAVEESTRLAPAHPVRGLGRIEQTACALSESLTAQLSRQARAQGVTLNTIIQAAWGILLGRLTGHDDVVFGITVAGRPPEIAGIETMVGLFINTLPLRIKLPPAESLLDLLHGLQDRQSRLITHQHLGLAEIQRLAGSRDLFDSLVVFENYPVDSLLDEPVGRLRASIVESYDAPHYPLSLVVMPGQRILLRLNYRTDL